MNIKLALIAALLLSATGCASSSLVTPASGRDFGGSMGPAGLGAIRDADSPRNVEPRYERPIVEHDRGLDRDRGFARFNTDCPRCR